MHGIEREFFSCNLELWDIWPATPLRRYLEKIEAKIQILKFKDFKFLENACSWGFSIFIPTLGVFHGSAESKTPRAGDFACSWGFSLQKATFEIFMVLQHQSTPKAVAKTGYSFPKLSWSKIIVVLPNLWNDWSTKILRLTLAHPKDPKMTVVHPNLWNDCSPSKSLEWLCPTQKTLKWPFPTKNFGMTLPNHKSLKMTLAHQNL